MAPVTFRQFLRVLSPAFVRQTFQRRRAARQARSRPRFPEEQIPGLRCGASFRAAIIARSRPRPNRQAARAAIANTHRRTVGRRTYRRRRATAVAQNMFAVPPAFFQPRRQIARRSVRPRARTMTVCRTSPMPTSPPAGCRTPNSTMKRMAPSPAPVVTKKRCTAWIPVMCYCPELPPARPATPRHPTTPNRAASNAIPITTGRSEKKSRRHLHFRRSKPAASDVRAALARQTNLSRKTASPMN